MKYYYQVLPGSQQYHGAEALTYSAPTEVPVGAVVKIPLQRRAVIGVVTGVATKPAFATKDMLVVYDVPPLPAPLTELVQWLRTYYPAPLGATVQQILPGDLTDKTIAETPGLTTNIAFDTAGLPPLTTEQQAALAHIVPGAPDAGVHTTPVAPRPDTYLLHGDTGTGKTRVYIELALRSIQAGRSAIILTPEIGLTSQLAATVRNVFGERVVVVHSAMTPRARQQSWLRIIRSGAPGGQPLVIVGPRSALFSPLGNIGLIVVDESHEPAYKQEQAPHYHATRVASQLAHLHSAALVLGSATPAISDYYLAEQKHKHIIRMRQLAAGSVSDEHITTEVVDLKDQGAFTRSRYLSTALLTAIDHSLRAGEQSLLYLNRRGTARVILCNACGWQATCPHCDLPLTYHHDLYGLQCHTCGYRAPAPTSCPECANTEIVFKVVGTKAIEEEVRRLYPSARIMRFDTDNKKAERFEQHYEAILAGDVDILIGTQLLAKGLDLPRLSTLGVVIADTSLTFPDYSAEERTYQLLAQVIGRVGRGHTDATGQSVRQRIIVQSYAPDRPVIRAALAHEWDQFYQNELAERKLFNFPPYAYLLKLTCRRASSTAAEAACEQFLYTLKKLNLPLSVEGPMPSFHARIDGKYEWQLVVRSRQRPALLRVIAALPNSGWSYDIDPVNLI